MLPGGEGRLNGREALFGVDAAERVEAASAVPQGPGGPALVCKAGQKLGCGPVKTGHITGGDHKAVALAGGKRCCQPGQRAHEGPAAIGQQGFGAAAHPAVLPACKDQRPQCDVAHAMTSQCRVFVVRWFLWLLFGTTCYII